MSDPVLRELKALDKKIEALTDSICSGGCKDYAEYRAKCGERNGMKRAREAVGEALKDPSGD